MKNYLYVFVNEYGEYEDILYYRYSFRNDCGDIAVRKWLSVFDPYYNPSGKCKIGNVKGYAEFDFHCTENFFNMLHSVPVQQAFEAMGVFVVFNYPFSDKGVYHA